jgi:hypothetical protein
MKEIEQEVVKRRVKYIRIAGDVRSVLRGVIFLLRFSMFLFYYCWVSASVIRYSTAYGSQLYKVLVTT